MAELYLFGAVVTSWCQPQGSDVLYVRPDVIFDGVKPIS
jgi:glucose-6-phosphate 1-epimerase